MTDKNTDTQASPDLEDALSKIVTLSPGASADNEDSGPDPENASGETDFSLGRLEQDLKNVQSRWRAVEREITDRDEKIGTLESAIECDRQTISTLEAELESVSSNNAELSNELASAEQEIGEWQDKCSEIERELESRDADLQLAQDQEVEALTTKNTELRERIQELQDYIDGRKSDWEKMQSQLRQYEDTVKGMSDSLGSHVDIVAGIEAEKAALAQTIISLERDLAALKGQQSEREANRSDMQETLDRQTRELGSLSSEATRLNNRIEELQQELDDKDEAFQRLQQELDEQIANSASLEERLTSEQSRFDKQSSHLEDLEKSLGSRGDTEHELQRKLDAAEASLEEASNKAAKEEIRADELDAMLREFQMERRNLETEVQAQRELIEKLEDELKNKQDNLDALDGSVNRQSAIGSGTSDLDLLIDDRWHRQSESINEGSEDLFERLDDDLVAPEELISADDEQPEHVLIAERNDTGAEVRYPLIRKEMTIGRARENDIRLQSKYVSRVHARIKVKGSDVYLEDAGSMNGFLVNSKETREHKLAHGDTVQFGIEKFRYLTVS